MVTTYLANRRLKIGDGWREPGEPVPEAYGWMRRDDWLHTGYILEAQVSEEQFRESLATYHVEDAENILDLVGLTEGVELLGDRATPRRVAPLKAKPAETKPAETEPKPQVKKKS